MQRNRLKSVPDVLGFSTMEVEKVKNSLKAKQKELTESQAQSEFLFGGGDQLFCDRLERGEPLFGVLREAQCQEYTMNFYYSKIRMKNIDELTEEKLKDLIPEVIPRNRFVKYLTKKEIQLQKEKKKTQPVPMKEYNLEDLKNDENFDVIDLENVSKITVFESLVGSGSFGRVLRGIMHVNNIKVDIAVKEVAIKNDDGGKTLDAILRESEIHGRLNSPYIVRHYGMFFNRVCNVTFAHYVLELCSRGDLSTYKIGLTPEKKLKVLSQLAKGMDYLHMKGIVHRDLKPQNILIDRRGNAKISDFGTSRYVSDTNKTFCGTISYLDPQCEFGNSVYDDKNNSKKLDVYAFGIISYELWLEKCAYLEFKDMNAYAKLIKIYKDNILPDFSLIDNKIVRDIAKGCCNKNVTERPSFFCIAKRIYEELLEVKGHRKWKKNAYSRKRKESIKLNKEKRELIRQKVLESKNQSAVKIIEIEDTNEKYLKNCVYGNEIKEFSL